MTTRSAVVVRRAVAADVARVVAIESHSFTDPWSAESFEASLTLPHIRFLVAEVDGAGQGGAGMPTAASSTVVGYVLAIIMGPEGEIADIAVSPEARGRGVGGALLDRMLEELGGERVRTFYLEVRYSNAAARRLYESREFGAVGRRRGYYQHPVEDALVLRRQLARG